MRTRLIVAAIVIALLVIAVAVARFLVGGAAVTSSVAVAPTVVASASESPSETPEPSSVAMASPMESPTASSSPTPTPQPTPATPPPGLPSGWAQEYERVVNGREADLVVRTGAIDNLGFGWPKHFTPFSGASTPAHDWICTSRPGAAPGTDRNELGTGVPIKNGVAAHPLEGYSTCGHRPDNLPQAIPLNVGALPRKIHGAFFQIFADDFQPVPLHSHFQVSLNGTRIANFENAINQLDQTGPIGKLLTLQLLPEYWPILKSGTVNLLIDDPTTGKADGYAVGFARILVNPRPWRYAVAVSCNVVDAAMQGPIARAGVSAGGVAASTDARGNCTLRNVPAGLVSVDADAVGYDSAVQLLDLPAGQHGTANFQLKRHKETVADLRRQIQQSGTVAIYGIHFDTASARIRADSLPSLNEVLQLIASAPSSHWIIAGHTDNQGGAAYNLNLSLARANSVVAWLVKHGVAPARLTAKGYGFTRPVADNATESGRALNRRVEVSLVR